MEHEKETGDFLSFSVYRYGNLGVVRATWYIVLLLDCISRKLKFQRPGQEYSMGPQYGALIQVSLYNYYIRYQKSKSQFMARSYDPGKR